MNSIPRRDLHSARALDAQGLPPGAEALARYLGGRGYAPHTIAGYVATFLAVTTHRMPCLPSCGSYNYADFEPTPVPETSGVGSLPPHS
jgi:hypothetical protein